MNKCQLILMCIFMILIPNVGKSQIIAQYDNGTVTVDEIREYMQEFKDYRQAMMVKYPDKSKRDPIIAHKIVYDRLLSKMAVKQGIDKNPDIQARVGNIEKDILSKVYIQKYITDKVKVSDAEVEKRYQEHLKTVFTTPEKWQFRYIFINSKNWDKDSSLQNSYSLATQILAFLKQGKSFSDLAMEYSDAEKAKETGGLVGPVNGSVLHPSIDSALQLLTPGEVSGIIKIPLGFQIVQLEKHFPSVISPYSEVKEKIRQRMINEKKNGLTNTLITSIQSEQGITKYYERLDQPDISPETLLIKSKTTTLRYSDLLNLEKITEPGKEQFLRDDMETILNQYILREPITRLAIKRGVRKDKDFQRLFNLHKTDVYASTMEMVILNQRIQPTESDYHKYYQEHGTEYTSGKEYLCREIKIPYTLGQDSSPDKVMGSKQSALQLAQEIYKKIQQGDKFEDLAKEYSSGDTAKEGGLLPWFHIVGIAAQYYKALQSLEPGKVSAPVEGSQFVLMLKLEQTRFPEIPPYETIEVQLKREYKGRLEVIEARKLEDELVNKAHFKVLDIHP